MPKCRQEEGTTEKISPRTNLLQFQGSCNGPKAVVSANIYEWSGFNSMLLFDGKRQIYSNISIFKYVGCFFWGGEGGGGGGEFKQSPKRSRSRWVSSVVGHRGPLVQGWIPWLSVRGVVTSRDSTI